MITSHSDRCFTAFIEFEVSVKSNPVERLIPITEWPSAISRSDMYFPNPYV